MIFGDLELGGRPAHVCDDLAFYRHVGARWPMRAILILIIVVGITLICCSLVVAINVAAA